MEKRKRLLFTIPNFNTAGSQYVLLNIIKNLDKNSFDIFIGVEKDIQLIPDVVPKDRKLLLPFSGNLVKDSVSFAIYLHRMKIDIVHSWDYRSLFTEALSCRLSATVFLYTKKNASWSKRWFLKSLLATHIVYNHPKMKSLFFSHPLLRKKVSLIPHGVDLNKFRPIETLKPDTGVFKLCCVGNIGDNKNQLFILKQLKKTPGNIHLFLYGKSSPSYLTKVESFIKQEGLQDRVHLEDFVTNDQLPQILNSIDVLVLASKKEGLPVSILEALACGVPVLCSDSGGGTRFIFNKDKGGVVFDLKKPQEFIDALLKFTHDKDYFSTKKREALEVAKNFDANLEAKAYKALYQQLS